MALFRKRTPERRARETVPLRDAAKFGGVIAAIGFGAAVIFFLLAALFPATQGMFQMAAATGLFVGIIGGWFALESVAGFGLLSMLSIRNWLILFSLVGLLYAGLRLAG